jgi:alkylhydroperoxidase family enzyme
MAVAVENACKYCTAGHHLAGKMFFDSSEEDLQALRNNTSLSTQKFDTLKEFALQVYRNHGRVSDKALQTFYDAGYNQAQAIEVVTNIAAKVMSNYINQLTLNELDEAAAPFAEGLSFA